MSFWSEDEEERRLRLYREEEARERKERLAYERRQEKDKARQVKKKAQFQARQDKYDAAAQEILNQNSRENKKEFMHGLGGASNLMQSVLGGYSEGTNAGLSKLRTETLQGSVMSLGRSSQRQEPTDNFANSAAKVPKLSRPF